MATSELISLHSIASSVYSGRKLKFSRNFLPFKRLCSFKSPTAVSKSNEDGADLCLLPLTSICLPTFKGDLMLQEPQHLAMLDVISEVANSSNSIPRFGAVPTKDEADSDVDISIPGCCCLVDESKYFPDGTARVQYTSVRRFHITKIHRTLPFLVASVEWIHDHSGGNVDSLEAEVWDLCCQVAKLSDISLPASLSSMAPIFSPPPRPPSVTNIGQADMLVWQKANQPSKESDRSRSGVSNPYWFTRELVAKAARQEAFSFAAAGLVNLTPSDRIHALQLRCTESRLKWVKNSLIPYVATLRARHSLLIATEEFL